MPQQFLHGTQVGARIQEVAGEGVEQRMHVQLPAAREPHHVDRAVEAFTRVGQDLGVLRDAGRGQTPVKRG